MKSILIPTDFSENSSHAVDVSIQLAKRQGAEIHFLHITDIPIDWLTLVEKVEKKLYADITQKVDQLNVQLEELVEKASEKGILAKKFLMYNKNYRGIIEHAEEYQNDMIVMGSQGASGLKEFLIGTYTQRVIRHAKTPVLVIKNKVGDINFDRITFYSDFRPTDLSKFARVVDLVKQLGGKLQLLLISTPNNFFETKESTLRLESYHEAAPNLIDKQVAYNAMREEEGLGQYCTENEVGMLALLYDHQVHKNSYERRHVEEFINHVQVPILSIPYV